MTRDDFERLFPVPDGVRWNGSLQMYTVLYAEKYDAIYLYNAKHEGYRAGREQGLREAMAACKKYEREQESLAFGNLDMQANLRGSGALTCAVNIQALLEQK